MTRIPGDLDITIYFHRGPVVWGDQLNGGISCMGDQLNGGQVEGGPRQMAFSLLGADKDHLGS